MATESILDAHSNQSWSYYRKTLSPKQLVSFDLRIIINPRYDVDRLTNQCWNHENVIPAKFPNLYFCCYPQGDYDNGDASECPNVSQEPWTEVIEGGSRWERHISGSIVWGFPKGRKRCETEAYPYHQTDIDWLSYIKPTILARYHIYDLSTESHRRSPQGLLETP